MRSKFDGTVDARQHYSRISTTQSNRGQQDNSRPRSSYAPQTLQISKRAWTLTRLGQSGRHTHNTGHGVVQLQRHVREHDLRPREPEAVPERMLSIAMRGLDGRDVHPAPVR